MLVNLALMAFLALGALVVMVGAVLADRDGKHDR